MLRNHLKIALRNVLKYPGFTLLNVGGLALGIAAAFVLTLYVRQELTYDRHFEDHDRIYRVASDFFNMGGFAKSQEQLLEYLPQAVPEIELVTRFDRGFRPTPIVVDDQVFEEPHFFFADTAFFRMFSYRFLHGNAETALQAPDEAVLSDRLAEKLFGSASAAPGRTVLVGKEKRMYRVSGVVETPSNKSHLAADLWMPLERAEPQTYWTNVQYYNYVKLRPGGTAADVERGLQLILRNYAYPASQFAGAFEEWVAGSHAVKFWVQPLKDIYLQSDFRLEITPGGDPTQVYALALIGIFILLIAGVNYVNLTTARSSIRAKEVGVKKTLGAKRGALVQQFLAETVVLSLLAMLIAAGMIELLLKVFAFVTGTTGIENAFADPWHLGALAVFSVVVGLLAGLYPAFYLSGVRPVKILKGEWTVSGSRGLRSALVIVQFAIGTGLGISSLVIYSQLSFLQNTDKGFDHEGVLVIENFGVLGTQAEAFRRQIAQQPQVRLSSFSSRTPTGAGVTMYTFRTPTMEESITIQTFPADEDYVPTLGMRLVAGRNFSGDLASDSTALILNEAAVRVLGLGDEPVGLELFHGRQVREVIGVVSDFHFQSLRHKIEPVVLMYSPEGGLLNLKLSGAGIADFMARLPQIWAQFSPEDPVRYSFLDDNFALLAEQERMLSRAVSFFTLLALLIACIGLFGLTAFAMQRRTKEIGIRKLFGATVTGLVVLIARDIARLVLIAVAVAAPVVYLLMDRWLEDFAYRIELGVGPFLLGGMAAIGIALLTVAFQAIRAALADPVKSLRYE